MQHIEYDSRNEEIGQLIEELFQFTSEINFEKICERLDRIYLDEEGEIRQNFRHEYTNISGKIRELIEYEEEGINPYNLAHLVDNIGYVYDYAVENNKKYVKNLFKLKDHIGLEAGRIELVEQLRWEITNSKESVTIQLQDLHQFADSLDVQIKESSDLIESCKKQTLQSENNLKTLEKTSDVIKTKMEDVHRDSITILGIFASIVLAFTTGMGFSSSVLQNLHLGSPYRMGAVIIMLAIVLLNMIVILLMYIDKIKTIDAKHISYPCFMIWIDVIGAVLLIFDFIAFKCGWLS